ncbi:MAG: hypothetical protein VB128_11495 [Sedimentibacter saalensis]|uniref:hypothetical protein n=1 Tax=Sedimentibacter saalensis TaxID=130788 RepID=UPI002B21DC30|nr:hypothetical protein [Sedimentibacter saalensis]MEA5095566.1 hypothetical protein [Sedimentibacter saalensis]
MNKKRLIAVFLIITIFLIAWSIIEDQNKRIYRDYENDISSFQNGNKELIELLENFIETPNIKDYSNIQYNMGILMENLISLSRNMSECYKKGLLNVDKTYDEGRDISNAAAKIIQNSQNLLIESIKLSNSEIELTEDKINTVYEELNSINDLFEPYYNSLK